MGEDTITIHLGCVLPEQEYKQVVEYLVACMNARYPNFTKQTLSIN